MLLTIEDLKVNILTANELKTKGISAVESRLKDDQEVIISVRGNNRYVVMEIKEYARLREYELPSSTVRGATN